MRYRKYIGADTRELKREKRFCDMDAERFELLSHCATRCPIKPIGNAVAQEFYRYWYGMRVTKVTFSGMIFGLGRIVDSRAIDRKDMRATVWHVFAIWLYNITMQTIGRRNNNARVRNIAVDNGELICVYFESYLFTSLWSFFSKLWRYLSSEQLITVLSWRR